MTCVGLVCFATSRRPNADQMGRESMCALWSADVADDAKVRFGVLQRPLSNLAWSDFRVPMPIFVELPTKPAC